VKLRVLPEAEEALAEAARVVRGEESRAGLALIALVDRVVLEPPQAAR
jgi:hypothetical protein